MSRRSSSFADVVEAAGVVVSFVALLLLFIVPVFVVGGLALRYAWDVVVLHTFVGAPRLSVAEAIGLSTIVGYLTYNYSGEHNPVAMAKSVGLNLAFFLATIWVLSLFIH